MSKLMWSSQLDLGIEVIDQQHRRIVEYINLLDDAILSSSAHSKTERIISDLVDYTVSHFGFEESLQAEAQYIFCKSHKKVHELFTTRVSELQTRFKNGENVAGELHSMLVSWLYNHIQRDDVDYCDTVKPYLIQQQGFIASKKGLFSRLFG